MALDFEVAKKRFRDSTVETGTDLDATLATAIETWLDSLSVGKVLDFIVYHASGFWYVTIIYLPAASITTITWTNATTTNVTPDADTEVNVEQAKSIAIQVDSTDTDSIATSIDVNVMATLDGTTWDSVPYAETNIGDNEVKTILVAPGPLKIRLRLDSNSSTRADVTAKVKILE
jgi:hypothetical protein